MNLRGCFIGALLLFMLTMASFAQGSDHRLNALSAFLERLPVKKYSADFIKAADRFHLDWRLLPCLSVLESGGGRAARNNNLFGWDSGRARFESFNAAIYAVAARLANSPHYRGKSTIEKLKTYNTEDSLYLAKMKKLMERLGQLSRSPKWEEASATSSPVPGGA